MKLIVDEDNIRLDKYISKNTDLGRNLVEKLITTKNILVNDKYEKPSYKVKEEDVIDINYIEEAREIIKQNIKLDVIFEDDHIIVVNKPSGMVTHPGSGIRVDTLVNALLYYTDKLSSLGGEKRRGIVHRLDKHTSGLILIAKTDEVHQKLVKGFKNKKIIREYTALVDGIVPSSKGKIDAPITKSKKDFRLQEVSKDGKEAITYFNVIRRYENNTLLKLNLETGRTHQIRVHLSYIGFPIYNDKKYGQFRNDDFNQYLHASKLEFLHPITNKLMTFESNLPLEFDKLLQELDFTNN